MIASVRRIGAILLLFLQYGFENRARSFVYFLIMLLNVLSYIAFWSGAENAAGEIGTTGWQKEELLQYYYLMMVLGMLLINFIESYVAPILIKEGQIVRFLLKPYSFYWQMFYIEISYRITQSFMSMFAVLFIALTVGIGIHFVQDTFSLIAGIGMIIMALGISFTYKMIIGISAFFITDSQGLMDFSDLLMFLFSGMIMPVVFFPDYLQTIAGFTPFPYFLYYPVVGVLGMLSDQEMIRVLLMQIVWLVALLCIYSFLWKKGVTKFTAIGN